MVLQIILEDIEQVAREAAGALEFAVLFHFGDHPPQLVGVDALFAGHFVGAHLKTWKFEQRLIVAFGVGTQPVLEDG